MRYKRRSDLDYLKAILNAGSFNAAAQKLFISQPAISQYVGRIEKENGIKIFNRESEPIQLTEEGAYFLKVEEQIEALRANREKYFQDFQKVTTGKIRIGSNPCRTATLLAEVVPIYLRRYPQVELEIIDAPIQTAGARLKSGEVDFVLTLEAFLKKDMAYTTILDENVCVAIPHDHPRAEELREYIRINGELPDYDFRWAEGERFVLLNRGVKFHDYFEDLCRKYNVQPKVILQTESIVTVLEFVREDVACGFVPDSMVKSSDTRRGPVFCSLKKELPVNRVAAAWNKNFYLSSAARKFIALLREHYRDLNSAYSEGEFEKKSDRKFL